MSEVPWGAIIAAGSAFVVAAIQFALSVLSLDARISKTAKLLKQVTEARPGSDAERALSAALDVLAARKTGRLMHGAFIGWLFMAWILGTLTIYALLTGQGLWTPTFWFGTAVAVGTGIVAGIDYFLYGRVRDRYHSVKD